MAKMNRCPICELQSEQVRIVDSGDRSNIDCPKCGSFTLSRSAIDDLPGAKRKRPSAIPVLSHAIRKLQIQDKRPYLSTYRVSGILKDEQLPGPFDAANNLLRYLGTQSAAIGSWIELNSEAVASIIGVTDKSSIGFVKQQFQKMGLVDDHSTLGTVTAALTLAGWDRFHELERQSVTSKLAFMAMKFSDPELDGLYAKHLKPAVKLTGFELRNLAENPPAGLIDNRLRVEIRNSRFLIADLTHGNNGAYWEAGFAEGLGKPVIYTCKKTVFEDPQKRTHFDTNHHHTVVWDSAEPANAVDDLKATIRATLPLEAIMADKPGQT